MAGEELSQDLIPLSNFKVKPFSFYLIASLEAEIHLGFVFVFNFFWVHLSDLVTIKIQNTYRSKIKADAASSSIVGAGPGA